MPNTVPMFAPAGFSGQVSVNVSTPPTSGQTYIPDVNGQIIADPRDVQFLIAQGFSTGAFPTSDKITTDNGATQTLTGPMVSGGSNIYHISAGGGAPTLTFPSFAAFVAANPGLLVNRSMRIRIVNRNSGVATVAFPAGFNTNGTLTIANGTWRDFVFSRTDANNIAVTAAGTGTDS